MTLEQFASFLNEKGCPFKKSADKEKWKVDEHKLATYLTVHLLKKKVGFKFYSGTPLKDVTKLNGPWLYKALQSCLNGTGAEICFTRKQKNRGKRHDEGVPGRRRTDRKGGIRP